VESHHRLDTDVLLLLSVSLEQRDFVVVRGEEGCTHLTGHIVRSGTSKRSNVSSQAFVPLTASAATSQS